jgi:hypothetical protein
MTLRVLWEDFGKDNIAKLQEVYSLPILAKRVSVSINDYTQADTFECEIDYKQFPFDPRAIRACGVTIHMEDMRRLFSKGRTLEEIKPQTKNVIFQGFADEEAISFNEQTRTVKLEGRDMTALLIDRQWLGGEIDISRPLDVIIAQLLEGLEETKKLEVDNRVGGELPTLGKYANAFNDAPQKKNSKQQESYWDVIQDLVGRAGLIAYIEIDKLVISKPRVLYSNKQALQFVYGRNLSTLDFKRKLGRRKNFNVIVRSLNVESKEIIQAEIPLEATDEWAQATGVKKEAVKIPKLDVQGNKTNEDQIAPAISFRVANINDKPKLIEIGQELFEELGRQQIEGSFSTKDMETTDGQANCVNLLKLRNGTPLKIDINQGDLKGVQRLSSVEEKAKFLKLRGYADSVAQALAETLSNPRFASPFYTKSVTFSLDPQEGFEIRVDFINFINTPPRLGGV